ncbi:MAG TPA: DUF5985 family protein [Vicinamibacterales bacterium]|nr:DUF5985 family protein [Vicinamibacterales bacterium]
MRFIVNILGCLTVALCAVLLLRAYRRVGARLLLWSGICFGCLTLNNALVAIDIVLLPDVDLFVLRNLSALVGIVALLYGLVMEAR